MASGRGGWSRTTYALDISQPLYTVELRPVDFPADNVLYLRKTHIEGSDAT